MRKCFVCGSIDHTSCNGRGYLSSKVVYIEILKKQLFINIPEAAWGNV